MCVRVHMCVYVYTPIQVHARVWERLDSPGSSNRHVWGGLQGGLMRGNWWVCLEQVGRGRPWALHIFPANHCGPQAC